MKRLFRWTYRSAALLSAVLLLAACVLWARSYSGSDYVERRWVSSADAATTSHDARKLQWTRGQLRLVRSHDTLFHLGWAQPALTPEQLGPRWYWGRLGAGHQGWDSAPTDSLWNRLGFASWRDGWESSFADVGEDVLAVPAWLPAVAFAVLPAAWVARFLLRRRRIAAGRCRACGYDLRATPDRCPECGAVASSEAIP